MTENNERKRQTAIRTILILVLILALLAIGWCVWYLIQYYKGAQLGSDLQTIGLVAADVIDEEAPEEQEYVEIPVDFDALWAINPDIYAWIEVPGTVISYPILHRGGDDPFYSHHSSDGAYYSGGSVYSEDYNSEDFTDPMTVLYGHNLRNGTMFAQLNDFADVTVFTEHPRIYVYLPDRALVYDIFCASPHSNEHLLANHDFTDREDFETFYSDLAATRNMGANFRTPLFPTFGSDRVLTLSTCYRPNNQMRFLVMGRLVADIPAKP